MASKEIVSASAKKYIKKSERIIPKKRTYNEQYEEDDESDFEE
jgi:hypothetical protein